MKENTDSDQGLILDFFEAWGDNNALAFSSVAAFIGMLAKGDEMLNFPPSDFVGMATLISILAFLFALHYVVIKKSILSIGKSPFQIPFKIYQPEIKYLIGLYNDSLYKFSIEDDRIKESLKESGYIDKNSELSDKGVRKAIDSKQTIRGRFVNYTAISVTALILFYSIIRILQTNIITESRTLFFVSAILILWVATVLMMANIISRRELLIHD